jgi:hypothetical protein
MLVLDMIEIISPLGKYKYDILKIPPVKCLISYVKTDTNKRLLISESHGNSNQCTPCRGNLINTLHTFHARSMCGPRPYVSHVIRV